MRPLASYEPFDETWIATSEPDATWLNPAPRLLRFAPRAIVSPLAALTSEIERSREMLSWDDDWDDAGSPRFEEATWVRATTFLERHARLLLKRGISLPVPKILPGPNGSIDLHWDTEKRELLINIPPGGSLAGFYGEAAGMNSIKGKVDLSSSDLGLFTWLTVTD